MTEEERRRQELNLAVLGHSLRRLKFEIEWDTILVSGDGTIPVRNRADVEEIARLRAAAAAQERLEAWNRVGHPVQRYVMVTSCALCWVVRLTDHSQNIEVSSVPRGENESNGSEQVGGRSIQPWRFWIDSSATLPEVINAALDEWERRYGEKEEQPS